MHNSTISLIKSRFDSKRPDLLLLNDFEDYCTQNSTWKSVNGPHLFKPLKISSRVYTFLHHLSRPILKHIKKNSINISLGLPYEIYLFSKTFPYFTFGDRYRVLWTYDVWEPKYKSFEELVIAAKINLLLLSSRQASEYFKALNIPGCEVHWIPESINPGDYYIRPTVDRSIDVLSFGRVYRKYHDRISKLCESNNLNYQFEKLNESTDVALKGVKPEALQFPSWDQFKVALSKSKICICFPKNITHPEQAGNVSTITLRYLQAMASKCLIVGEIPLETKHLFDYDPFISVDWNDPFGQLQQILSNYDDYAGLIERNYRSVTEKFHYDFAINNIQMLINQNFLSENNLSVIPNSKRH